MDASGGCVIGCSSHILHFTKTYTVLLYVSIFQLFYRDLYSIVVYKYIPNVLPRLIQYCCM